MPKVIRAKDGTFKGSIGDGKKAIPTPADITTMPPPPVPTPPEPYPVNATRQIVDEWMARQRAAQEADREARNRWRTENYPEDVRGTGLDYPFTPSSPIIRETVTPTGETVYHYPATAFKSADSPEVIEIAREHRKAADELVESGLAQMDERGVWMVQACESDTSGYNHRTKILKEEYDSLPPLHKFVLASASDSFGSTLIGRTFRVSGSD